jgi:hypothetical protein
MFILQKCNRGQSDFMWRINYKRLTLQEVLIMAYMNLLEGYKRRLIQPTIRAHDCSGFHVFAGIWQSPANL